MSIYALHDDKPQSEAQEFHLNVNQATVKAGDFIASNIPYSKQQIKSFMAKGAVWLESGKHTRRLRRADKSLVKNNIIHLYINHAVLDKPCPMPLLIDDQGDYSLWFKPNGILCQGSKWGDHTTINRWAELHLKPQRPAFIVHRIDKATSGLIILAHTKKAARCFSQLFFDKSIHKTYLAIVAGQWQNKQTINSNIDGKKAISHITLEKYNKEKNLSKVRVTIETGRKHQIRIHLAESGFPIIGDRFYGKVVDDLDMQLLAYQLVFTCPFSNKEKCYQAPSNLLLF